MGCSQVKPSKQATDIMGNALGEIALATIGAQDGEKQQAWGDGTAASAAPGGHARDVNGNHRELDKMDDIRLEDVKETIAEELGERLSNVNNPICVCTP